MVAAFHLILIYTSRSNHVPCRKCISFIRTLQVRINRSKTENDKQMSLNDFLLSLFSKVCTSYVAVVQQTLISLAAHNLN